jgi:head-tail adaptor
MLESLGRIYPSLCTIQSAVETQDTAGQPIKTWADLIQAIPCRKAPAGGREVKLPDQTYGVADFVIELRGYYPSITRKMHAVVDGTVFDILNPESDGNNFTTRLQVQVVT